MVKATTKKLAAAAMAVACLGLASTAKAGAVDVSYVLQDLGGGLFKYDYTFTNNSLGQSLTDIAIDFDKSLYDASSLQITLPSAEWSSVFFDEVDLGPGALVPAAVDIFSTGLGVAPGSTAGGFAIQFRWLGPGAPVAQAFNVYDASFAVIDSGRTADAGTPPPPGVPEPQTLALVLLALTTAAAAARRGAGRPAG